MSINTTTAQPNIGTSDEDQNLITIAVVSSSLSLVASAGIIVSYLVAKQFRRHFYYYWVLQLSITDFLISIAGLYDWTDTTEFECTFFSVVLGFGLIGSYFFIIYIAQILYWVSTIRNF